MPRPVVVSSPPIAVALEPNGECGSLPSAAISLFLSGSCGGAFWKDALTGSSGMPGSLALGGVALGDLREEVAGGGDQVGEVDAVPDVEAGGVRA